ncbi:Hypothetical predicted protein [Mytilus galloprovincialis]|uniref:Uncharacterized protein n=1 Tax=Mytilus galloprovincialis TaxID=29158 RepID=A0A8B6C8F7_MYTGA|nr:Hypothetical predicted protein [Mytilus galloprovincialis]
MTSIKMFDPRQVPCKYSVEDRFAMLEMAHMNNVLQDNSSFAKELVATYHTLLNTDISSGLHLLSIRGKFTKEKSTNKTTGDGSTKLCGDIPELHAGECKYSVDVYNVTSEEQELNADLNSTVSAEDFSVTTCKTQKELSEDELTGLEQDLGLIAEELESETPLNTSCIVVSDSEEDDISLEATVVDTTTTTALLTLIRKDITYSDGSMETTRNSTVSFSTGVNPETIDFEHLAMTVVDDLLDNFRLVPRRSHKRCQ